MVKDAGVNLTDENDTIIDAKMRNDMERFVRENYDRDAVSQFPQEWMGDIERSYFCRVAESVLGENNSDRWLQNKVFKGVGEDYLDMDKPIEAGCSAQPKADFDPIASEFLSAYSPFINTLINDMQRYRRFLNDVERIGEGMMMGIAYALNEPKPGNMDQRMNFFALFPYNLTIDSIADYCDNPQTAKRCAQRIKEALDTAKFLLKKQEAMTTEEIADGYRSVFSVRRNEDLKNEMLKALATVADDNDLDDGLICHLSRIVKSGRCKDLEKFVAFHINKRTLSARSKEGKRKEHEVSMFGGDEDNQHTFDEEISVSEYVDDGGVTRTSNAMRHVEQRQDTQEERHLVANKAKEITSESLEETVKLVAFIRKEMRRESIEKSEQVILSAQQSNDSKILGVMLPEALHYYVSAAMSQISALIHPSNEGSREKARSKGLGLIYKLGRSTIGFTQQGQRDLGSLVDLPNLGKSLDPYVNSKKKIFSLVEEGKTDEEISMETNLEIEFVEDTRRHIDLLKLSQTNRKKYVWLLHEKSMKAEEIKAMTGYAPGFIQECLDKYLEIPESKRPAGCRIEDCFDEITPANIKNSFSWRWTQILPVLYAPLNTIENKAIVQEYNKWVIEGKIRGNGTKGRRKYKPIHVDDLMVAHAELPLRFRRRLRRKYQEINVDALADLQSLLPVHCMITGGTIPIRSYPERVRNQFAKIDKQFGPSPTKDQKAIIDAQEEHLRQEICSKRLSEVVLDGEYQELGPGAAWGHNVCRNTGESNVRMFYDIFFGGLNRSDKAHKEIRWRCSMVIRMGRAKASAKKRKSYARKQEV